MLFGDDVSKNVKDIQDMERLKKMVKKSGFGQLEVEVSGEGAVSLKTGLTQTGIMAKTLGQNRDLRCPRHTTKKD